MAKQLLRLQGFRLSLGSTQVRHTKATTCNVERPIACIDRPYAQHTP